MFVLFIDTREDIYLQCSTNRYTRGHCGLERFHSNVLLIDTRENIVDWSVSFQCSTNRYTREHRGLERFIPMFY